MHHVHPINHTYQDDFIIRTSYGLFSDNMYQDHFKECTRHIRRIICNHRAICTVRIISRPSYQPPLGQDSYWLRQSYPLGQPC